ncbi:unnamed protein product [Arctogadus glacialis]
MIETSGLHTSSGLNSSSPFGFCVRDSVACPQIPCVALVTRERHIPVALVSVRSLRDPALRGGVRMNLRASLEDHGSRLPRSQSGTPDSPLQGAH